MSLVFGHSEFAFHASIASVLKGLDTMWIKAMTDNPMSNDAQIIQDLPG